METKDDDKRIRFFYETLCSKIHDNIKEIYFLASHIRGDATEKSYYNFVVILRKMRGKDIYDIRETEVAFLDRFDALSSSRIYDEKEWKLCKNLPIGIIVRHEGILL